MSHRFKICRFNHDKWSILDSFMTYDEADNAYDYWAEERYPNSLVEIIEFEEVPV